MATDLLVSRESKSLQDEFASAKMERTAKAGQSAATSSAIAPATATEASAKPPEHAELQGYLRQLAEEVTEVRVRKCGDPPPLEFACGAPTRPSSRRRCRDWHQ
jgi:hypothetical protein